jgi:hypothetical protein
VNGETIDGISVREVDSRTAAFVTRMDGKIVLEYTRTISADGNTLTVKSTGHPKDGDQMTTAETAFKRVKPGLVGAHEISDSWQESKYPVSENDLLATYKSSGNKLSMSAPTGESFTLKPDGKDYPISGSYYSNSISLKRIDERTIEQTYKRDGKVVGASTTTVSLDGQKLTSVWTESGTRRKVTEVAYRQ